jgi:hypothetical protein
MKLKSLYPPICIKGDVSKQWYIIAGGVWHPVDRQYQWEELKGMWEKIEYTKAEAKSKNIKVKSEWKVSGSKGNVYKVINDDGFWSCSCPAHGFGRGKDCKHIKQIKDKQNGKASN